jgi:hypothetical protein
VFPWQAVSQTNYDYFLSAQCYDAVDGCPVGYTPDNYINDDVGLSGTCYFSYWVPAAPILSDVEEAVPGVYAEVTPAYVNGVGAGVFMAITSPSGSPTCVQAGTINISPGGVGVTVPVYSCTVSYNTTASEVLSCPYSAGWTTCCS